MANLLQSGVASAERVFEFLDADEEVSDEHHAKLVEDACGRVSFENVWARQPAWLGRGEVWEGQK